jgi:adenine-specific DNA methylase
MQPASARLLVQLLQRLAKVDGSVENNADGVTDISNSDNAEKHGVTPRFRLFDPFMGSGAVLVTGMAEGCVVHGSDLSPLAVFVSQYVLQFLITFARLLTFLVDTPSLHSTSQIN